MEKNIKFLVLLIIFNSIGCFGKKQLKFVLPNVSPKDSVEIFKLPAYIQQFSVRDFALSPTGDEIFITVESNKNTFSSIVHFQKIGKKWKSDIASFSGNYSDLEPTFSPDGNTLYFVSNRPLQKDSAIIDFDIWKVEKINGGWSEPKNLGAPLNTEANEFYPAITTNGNLYYTASYKDGRGKEDIWMSEFINGKYTTPTVLSDAINSTLYEFNAFVSPADDYIIFTSCGRADDLGGCDLYMSKKDANGNWTAAKNLGNTINSTALDYCPFVSFNKKQFYFTSNRSDIQKHYKNKLNLNTFLEEIGQLQNGKGNIYWINADEILK